MNYIWNNAIYLKVTVTETDLVERLRQGDLEAFDMIYDMYAGKLYSFGMKYLRNSADAEELVQSVFMKVWENSKKLDRNLSFRSYLFTIAYNDICKLFRRKSYLRKYVDETLYENSEITVSTEEGIDYQSVIAEVQKIMNTLPEKQKEVFIKSRLEGKSAKEISAELGLSPGTIDNYISGAMKFIRSRLNKDNLPVMLILSLFVL